MKKLTISAIALCASLTAGSALADNCPIEMKVIDEAVANSTLSVAELETVDMLRAKGEQLYKSGDDEGCIKVIGEAKVMLGL